MIAADLSPYTTDRIEAIVDRALAASGALGVLPTPLEAVGRHARIRAVEPVTALPAEVRVRGREILGALWFEERVVYVDERQSAPRRRFTEAHEIIHALCPWHVAVLREDTEDELFRPVSDAVEAEANAGAGMLLFQGSAFARRAEAAPCSIATAHALAREHGASVHATLHHYVQTHPRVVAMLTTGRFPRKDGSLPVWRSVESRAFRRRYGAASAHYPQGLRAGAALHALAEAARTTSECPAAVLRLGDAARGQRFRAEAHYNRHAFLILLAGLAGTRGRKDGAS
ncbi:MAG: ImmA/IrrE family metallo-endopeptidase [Solirubrobacteraceae bacterium]